jgi:hypothetical protein
MNPDDITPDHDPDPDPEARQRLSAQLALAALDGDWRPTLEVTCPHGYPVALLGWNGTERTPQDRQAALAAVLAVAATFQPGSLCLVYDARMAHTQGHTTEEAEADYAARHGGTCDLAQDPEAVDCLMLLRSRPEDTTVEVMPYGRDDQGRIIWRGNLPPQSVNREAAAVLRRFWTHPAGFDTLRGCDTATMTNLVGLLVPGFVCVTP